ncbi:MAG: right-handed parallel beta-helix repeat-containing protein [Ignavibacteria bacterium]|nr:right-handed parallel beta-helix repeat-containing protein [Ignavibacteria bacterium]
MFISKYLLSVVLITVSLSNSFAATYYISNNGSDSNNGLSSFFAWKTIDKLNTVTNKILPGDAILFERGGYFIGQINLFSGGNVFLPLVIGAYGEGINPVISGAVPVKDWKIYKKNIYEAEVDKPVKNLFFNQEVMILARYPNTGFLKVKEPFSDPKTGFGDNELKQTKGYWEGSNIRIRTIDWAYEYSPVSKFINNQITFLNKTFYDVRTGWGYYFDNKFSELDAEKEWYYKTDKSKKTGIVYFYPKGDQNPDNSLIEGSIYDYGIYSFKDLSNVIIQNIEFKYQIISGIYMSGNKSKILIDNCTFNGQFQCGVNLLNASRNCEISNSRFYNINGKAIYLISSEGAVISKNIFRNSGMIPGYGTTGDAFGMSGIIALNSNGNIISGNCFENTGHDAINCIGNSNIVEKNIITNSLLCLNDGGAIKSYGDNNKNTYWRNNFIFGVKGNLDATSGVKYSTAAGIYLDAYCSEMTVNNNTISGCNLSAINLYDECKNNKILNNVCYNNHIGIYFNKNKNPMINNSVTNNIFFGLNDGQYSLKYKALSQGFIPGKSEGNIYANPVRENLFMYQSGNLSNEYDFSGWKKLFGNNLNDNSKIISGEEIIYSELLTNMSDDTSKFLLSPGYVYKDINLKSISGSVDILPWSSKIIIANSDITNLPSLNTAGETIDFGNSRNGNLSSPQWYKLICRNLKSSVTIKSPEGFVISLDDDSGYSDSITLSPAEGKIEKIIFVKFIPSVNKNYYGFINNTSLSVSDNVKVKGDGR